MDTSTTLLASDAPAPVAPAPAVWRAAFAGLCATLVGLGLARFAYTPLLPAIIQAHWFEASQATYLGAANLVGYLAGAMLAGPLAARSSARTVLRGMMAATTLALFACAWPVDFAWFFGWRLVSGIGGGALIVLAAPTILHTIPAARRGAVGGFIFVGVGLGIAASGTLVPLLLHLGLMQAWLGLGFLALVLTFASWSAWPAGAHPAASTETVSAGELPKGQLRALYAAYALNAVGLVPHMIFLVDYVARGLGRGLQAGALHWVVFGAGAVVGPLISGRMADRLGAAPALRIALVSQIVAVLLPALGWFGAPGLLVSSLVVGAFTPGIVPLVFSRIQELLRAHPTLHRPAWSHATASFAVLQAVGAYGMSFLLVNSGGNYGLLFGTAAGALTLALVIDLASRFAWRH
ncbi:MAG TPA: YbfB/YjiJ family MFS transporter [Burkholderiaceae bacterium]|jgi:predicted MFS family arabinose efflux permease